MTASVHEWGSTPDFVGPRHELRERLLLRLFLSAAPGPDVLDAGAGQGTFSRRLVERGFRVTSSDASTAAVSVLRDRLSNTVVEADVTELPFEDGSFDAVVLGEVLEHVEDDVAAVQQVARVLRPSGVLALSVPANPDWFGPSDVWAGHKRRYTREALLAVCEAGGLSVERCLGWGFPVSAFYHRRIYERHVETQAARKPTGWARAGGRVLAVALQVDRLFVGRERGALGFLLLARR
jgi:SAM-dependent methyltransferase